ncbi:MAG: excinuclease ABC subunit UvrC [Candidatus Daviesbacteria bacterium]|nr:MAG: excinuclease ABC subunit UvrC [Candidatus Daviesbacteria bacterium]
MIPAFITSSQIPRRPGVYQFKDKSGGVIYVGKAIDLRARVASYFNSSHDLKTATLVGEIAGVETILVESELEALILEANLIKKYLPKFNIRLVDDKDYLYIRVTKEDYPKILTARKKDLAGSLKYFGPFPSSTTVKATLKSLRRVFPWCSNPPKITKRSSGFYDNEVISKTGKACFYYHLGLCPGVCTGEISPKNYKKNIANFIKFMEGKHFSLIRDLNKQMTSFAKAENFEAAQKAKKMIDGINYLLQANRVQSYLENPNFLEEQRQKALENLQQALNLKQLPERIEGYDVSNIQGRFATGSMVVLTNGEIDKSQYRKFKISPPAGGPSKPNDVGMHAEMMRRRLKNNWPLPNLIIIDGGIAQVRAIHEQLLAAHLQIPTYGLAKRMEWLYQPDGTVTKLPKSSPALKLLQRLRDESHRFAITFYRSLHRKATFDEN